MNVLIEKLKISNFLSFFGEYEVHFKPYTTIMCNFYEGKDDFFRAFEFVFGASLSDLRVEKPLDLVQKALREEFLINRDIHCYVEVTLSLLQEKGRLKFSRGVKNGMSNSRVEHKISDLVTSSILYEEKLSSLGIHIKHKNLTCYKSYFSSVIWGSSEDLERTICTCLRESYLFDEWRRANNEVQYLTNLKCHTAVKMYTSMKRSHSVVLKYTKKFEDFSSHMETAAGEFLRHFIKNLTTNDSSSEGSSSLAVSAEEMGDVETERLDTEASEMEMQYLREKLDDLKMKEAILSSQLYNEEIKLAAKTENSSILLNRISVLKTRIKEKEIQMSKIWKNIRTVESEFEILNQKISLSLISLQHLQIRKFRQNRLSQYGRFCDYLQPSRYVELLKQIIGSNIFYAHLCDSLEDAIAMVKQLNDLKYEHREVFLPLENYSHKLRDIITASGEKGIQINTLEELLIFLCKLKHYDLLKEVPVIVQRDFNFEKTVPMDYIIYIKNNIHFTSDGLMSVKAGDNEFFLETENEMWKKLNQFYTEEEMNYRKRNDLLFLKWKTQTDMNSLENDIFCLKQKCRIYTQKPRVVRESWPEMEIYEEYHDLFKEYIQEKEKYESDLQQEKESFPSEKDSSNTSVEEFLSQIVKDLENVISEKRKTQQELENLSHGLYLHHITPFYPYRRKSFINFQNNVDKSKLFFEKEFKKLKKFMRKDDLDDFLGSQEWRTTVISSLNKDLEEIKRKLKTSMLELQNISTTRKARMYQLFDHCNRYLQSTFNHILDGALPFIELNFGPGEEKIHVTSCLGGEKINVVDIQHFNTLLKFISAFSILLEIAKFDKIPFMVIDDIEEYLPLQNDNLTAVLDSSTLENILPENENPRFCLLMRLGQFLKLYIKKNTPGKVIQNNGSSTDYVNGPVQLVCFAKEDFIHTSEHYLWIQNQILPNEYITESCNSYSGIYEIKFGNAHN